MKRSRETQEDMNPASPGSPGADMPPSSPRHTSKYTELDLSDSDTERSSPSPSVRILCSLPPHSEMAFDSYTAYEAHYNSLHTNRCLQCRDARSHHPSPERPGRPYCITRPAAAAVAVAVAAHRLCITARLTTTSKIQFSCFVEGCDRKCMTHQKRRMHMIDKHMYPKNFFFAVTRDGIDGRRSLLVDGVGRRRRRTSSAASQTTGARHRAATLDSQTADAGEQSTSPPATGERSTPAAAVDADVDAITGSMASLQFVPGAVKFGTRNRLGFAKR
ncbi:zinc finger protein [Cordyceps javanica]|uniref:Zinc finger protein n=1 Tax=Cordyceps javanica TaxID=43265 RepID=A0A545UYG2_9HYPO|nr:zinc finger protein [Cordyceps javanica]